MPGSRRRSMQARAAIHARRPMRPAKPTSSRPSTVIRERGDQDALGAAVELPANTPAPVANAAAAARPATITERTSRFGAGAERLVRALARLGAAARRHRARHHLRRHGRHQHGARRNGDARRLHDLCRAGADAAPHPALSIFARRSRCRSRSWSRAWSASLIERTIMRFLYGRPLETLLATWGCRSFCSRRCAPSFGPNNRAVGTPAWMSGAFDLGQLAITYNRLWIICFTFALFFALLGAAARSRGSGWRCARCRRTAPWRRPWASAPNGSMR